MNFNEVACGDGSIEVDTGARKLACPVCESVRFHERDSLLSTRAATLFNVAWANAGARNYICIGCGYIFWFLRS